jgi:predicted lipoprotein
VRALRACILLAIGVLLPVTARADPAGSAPPTVAVQQGFLQAAYHEHFAPRAMNLKLTAGEFKKALDAMCRAPNADSLQAARLGWVDTMLAWESAGAILIGPLLERHTAANIDFWPPRPNMIEAVLRNPPSDTITLRRTGVAARGLPALEWLLWASGESPPAAASPGACGYALLIAQDLLEEAQALVAELTAIGNRTPAPDAVQPLLGELINQTIGAVDVLRRKRLLNPVTVRNPKSFARSLSGEAQAAWLAQWDSIRDLLIGNRADGAWTVSNLLKESGLGAAARRLEATVAQSDSAIRKAVIADPASIKRAAEMLMTLRRTVESEVAEPLAIPVSFSDFDGD